MKRGKEVGSLFKNKENCQSLYANKNSKFAKNSLFLAMIIVLLTIIILGSWVLIKEQKVIEEDKGTLYNIGKILFFGWSWIIDFQNYVTQDLAVKLQIVDKIPITPTPEPGGGGGSGGSPGGSETPVQKSHEIVNETNETPNMSEGTKETPQSAPVQKTTEYYQIIRNATILVLLILIVGWIIFFILKKIKRKEHIRKHSN